MQTRIDSYFQTEQHTSRKQTSNNQTHRKVTNEYVELLLVNARSVTANLCEIEVLCADRKPKVLFCSEARITEDIVYSEYKIENYTPIVCYAQSRFTGGVVIYVNNELKFKVIENCHEEKQMWCLAIELFDSAINGMYSVMYRSPAANINECFEFTDKFLEKTINPNKLNVVTGDININMNDLNTNSRALLYLFEKHGLSLIVNFDTRVTNTSQTLIDYVLTNNKEKVSCKPIEHENISDHKTISIEIAKNEVSTASYENVLSWSMYNKTDLIEYLRNCDWSK